MKKILVALMTLLLLTGCSAPSSTSSVQGITDVINRALTMEIPGEEFNNASKEYYSYYLPKSVGREDRDATSNIFSIYGNKAILNLDVAGIINSTYYEEETVGTPLRDVDMLTNLKQIRTGTCYNAAGEKIYYRIMVNMISEDTSYISLQTQDFIFVATCPVVETDEMLFEMIRIIRSCLADRQMVADTYSNKNDSVERPTLVTLFRELLPETGKIVDYLDNWKNDPSFQIIDSGQQQGDDVPEVIDPEDGEENIEE